MQIGVGYRVPRIPAATAAARWLDPLARLRCRVIALLEFYLRKVPGSPLLPAIVPPLLRALSRASRSPDDKTLAERLKVRSPTVAPPHPS